MLQAIPSTLAPFFQEYDLKNLRVRQDAFAIIERILRFGTRTGWL